MDIDLRLPWTIAPLKGKYYGTDIVDSEEDGVASIWNHERGDVPSERQKEAWGEPPYDDMLVDGHWESARDYARAAAIVAAVSLLHGPLGTVRL